jgi:hypothetical protein
MLCNVRIANRLDCTRHDNGLSSRTEGHHRSFFMRGQEFYIDELHDSRL